MNVQNKSNQTFKARVMDWINGPVLKAFGRMGAQRHLSAIRNGIVATIPFVIIGAMCLLLLNFPVGSVTNAVENSTVKTTTIVLLKEKLPADLNNFLLYVMRLSLQTIGLMSAFGIGSELGKSYKFSQTTSGLMGLFGFILLIIPTNGGTWAIATFAGGSIFTAIIGSVVAVEILHFCYRFKITIKMPAGVPDAVANSFASLFPIIFAVVILGGTRYLLGFDVTNFLSDVLQPLKNILVGSLGGAILIVLIVTLFWWVGIHGVSMVGAVIRPLWQEAIDANSDWFLEGAKGSVPYAVPEQFLQWFVWIGGSGATIGLIIAGLIFARSQQVKQITRVSAVPAIFNINEPVIFGLPIILNPILFIPFVLGPVGMTIVSYLLMKWMNVNMVMQTAWTLPGPIGAYFSAGADWKAIIISLIAMGMSVAMWTPFVIAYDRKIKKEEQGQNVEALVISEEEVKKASRKAKGLDQVEAK